MKKYNIKVNGVNYEVEVEEVKEGFISNQPPMEVSEPVPEKVNVSPQKQVKKTTASGIKIECPMPGTVIKVNVRVGENIKKGQVMFILEAMKMENEIMAPQDGKIIEVSVANGATVNTGDVLGVIE